LLSVKPFAHLVRAKLALTRGRDDLLDFSYQQAADIPARRCSRGTRIMLQVLLHVFILDETRR
jgi:hypothetical protein